MNILEPGGWVDYRKGWLTRSEADALLRALLDELDWKSAAIRMFGKIMQQPRRIEFQGDRGLAYRYSGTTWRAGPWHPGLAGLRTRLETEFGISVNCVLANLYRNERDSMGWHADDEPELGPAPLIASLSLGAERRFVMRSRTGCPRKLEFWLEHGSLLRMGGQLQQHWEHQLPKVSKATGPRINLSFRQVWASTSRSVSGSS